MGNFICGVIGVSAAVAVPILESFGLTDQAFGSAAVARSLGCGMIVDAFSSTNGGMRAIRMDHNNHS
uniref:Uncharacterized protein n=1 Tax=Lepeophtheirus salmonis TaxID=72036 RepID=A0A0K2UX89_LEPSM